MSQSLSFKGYRVSGIAKPFNGKWAATYEIRKVTGDPAPVRRCNFVIGECSIAAAENAALLRGVAEVNTLVESYH